MKASTQEAKSLSAPSYGLQIICGRKGTATKSWLRLRAAVVAAAVAVLFILGTGAAQFAQAQVESVLHNFTGPILDGYAPYAPLIHDSKGNLYGTTEEGGYNRNGTVFEMVYDSSTNTYTETVLYSFEGGTDGGQPEAGLIMDSSGNLYGTTEEGGTSGYGTVFEVTKASGYTAENVLYSFGSNTNDGTQPMAGLIMDSNGNLYGTTSAGGYSTAGTVFKLSPPATQGGSWSETVLHDFGNGSVANDGSEPRAGLIMDSNDNLYGTTGFGGANGDGTVFELVYNSSAKSYGEKVLYSFGANANDAKEPFGGLIMDSNDNLYGTTWGGGSAGTVFELAYDSSTKSYTEKVLYSFTGTDGAGPWAALIMDSAGNLYGTTDMGGSSNDGTVFELTQASGYTSEAWHFSFSGSNGESPAAGLIMDSAGNLHGTTFRGGSVTDGTVFGIAPVKFSATSLTFGDVKEGTASAAQKVTITNIGIDNFSYKTASISGTNAADFAITSNTCSTAVASSGTCSVSVTFAPSTATAESASLNLSQRGMTQTVSLTGTGVYPTVKLSSSSLTFTSQAVGSTSSSQTVTLTNTSNVTLNVTSVGVTGDFAITSNTCTGSVAAGNTCTVGVTFTPTATGTQTGTLSFTDDTASGLQNVTLTGTGTVTTVSVSPTTLSFGQQMAGTKSADQTVTVTNTGSSINLNFSTISASNNFVIDAAKTTCTTTAAVAPGGSCQVAVYFAPTTGGTLTLPGTLTLTDDASPATQSVALSGTGEAISVSPMSLTFGSTVVGKTSSSQSVTVTNNGTAGVTLTSFTATGDFAVNAGSTTCSTSTALAGGATCKVAVAFTPMAAGTETGSLAIASDAGSGSVALSGTGTAPGVTLSPSSLTFSGTVVGNTASAQSVTLTNSGTSSLTISGITASGEFAIASAGTTCSTSKALAASGSCTIAVTFSPDGAETNTGAVTITDNAGSSPQIIALSGEGEDFTLGTASGSSSSASISAGGTASYTLALVPEGGFNQAVNLACSGAPAYATCTVSPASVTPNGTSNSSVSVKVSTTAASLVGPGPGNFGPPPSGGLPVVAWLGIIGLLGLIVLVKFSPKGGRVRRAAPWATLALAAALCAGCGGGSTTTTTTTSSNSTPAGTYTVTVTAKSGSLTQTSQVTLTVK